MEFCLSLYVEINIQVCNRAIPIAKIAMLKLVMFYASVSPLLQNIAMLAPPQKIAMLRSELRMPTAVVKHQLAFRFARIHTSQPISWFVYRARS